MKPETMQIILWIIAILIAVIGFFCGLGINIVISKLREISNVLQNILIENSSSKADAITTKERMSYLDDRVEKLESRVHSLETREIMKP